MKFTTKEKHNTHKQRKLPNDERPVKDQTFMKRIFEWRISTLFIENKKFDINETGLDVFNN